jgi:uncharacterized protein (DUF302 family)
MQEKLQEKGIVFDQRYHILEVCNPIEANRVLSENLIVGYFLPCKIAVDKGKTKMGMPKPTALIGMVDSDRMQDIASDVEKINFLY